MKKKYTKKSHQDTRINEILSSFDTVEAYNSVLASPGYHTIIIHIKKADTCKAKFFLNRRILCDVSLQLILPFNVPKVCKGYGEATQKSSSMMTLSKGNGMLRWRHLELNVEIKEKIKA